MNPYADVSAGNDYFATRVGTDAWDNSEDADKIKALSQATRIIDALNMLGQKFVADQENSFPRFGQTDVPYDIVLATCEIAFALLDGINPELEYENLMQTSSGYANVKSTYNRDTLPEHILAGVPSITAWRYIKPWLVDGRSISLIRVN